MKYGIRQKSLLLEDNRLFIEAKSLGFDGVELNTELDYTVDRLWVPGETDRIKKLADDSNIEIFTISLSAIRNYGFLNPDSNKRKIGQKLIRYILELGSKMNVSVLMLPMLSTTHKDVSTTLLISGLKEAVQIAEENGIYIALEVFLSADDVLEIIQQTKSEFLKISFDVGITTVCGYNVYEEIVKLKDVIAQIHIKDSIRPKEFGDRKIEFPELMKLREKRAPLGKDEKDGGTKWAVQLGDGSVDFSSVKKAIHKINYDGYLILETPPGKDPMMNAARNLNFIRENI